MDLLKKLVVRNFRSISILDSKTFNNLKIKKFKNKDKRFFKKFEEIK